MTAPMSYRRLGRSGLQVAPICLGTMMFGGRTDESEARSIIAAAREAGVNFIDTADLYAGGRSEEIVGRAIAAERHYWVVATKIANHAAEGPNGRGLSRKWLLEEVPRSLARLGTDFIDILYLHREDAATPAEEIVRALGQLQRMGAVRYFGVSNHKSWRLALLHTLCREEGIDPPVVSQPLYHLINRQAEVEHLPACAQLGVGVVPYSPLARGVLTGKYLPERAPPDGSRASVRDKRMMETEFRRDALLAGARFTDYAHERGVEPTALALAWVLANPLVTGFVAGPRTLEQWQSYQACLHVKLSEQDEAFVDSLVPPGHVAGGIFTDPAYPVEGRPCVL